MTSGREAGTDRWESVARRECYFSRAGDGKMQKNIKGEKEKYNGHKKGTLLNNKYMISSTVPLLLLLVLLKHS